MFSAHLRAFLVVPVVPPSCCLRLAPLPFPLLPAAMPPLKRRQIIFNELRQKYHVDTNSMGTNIPNMHLCNITGGFPSQKQIGLLPGLNERAECLMAQEHWVLAVSSNEPVLHFQLSFLSELQLPGQFLRM